MLAGQGRWARSRRFLFVQAMSEEQLKPAEAEATAQVEDDVEEISEEDLDGLDGVVGGTYMCPTEDAGSNGGRAGLF